MRLILFITLLVVCSSFSDFIPLKISGNSMSPELVSGDIVFLDKDIYKNESVNYGDLVAIKFSNRKNMMVKRIIAIPGDSVSFSHDGVVVNGKIAAKCTVNFEKSILYIQLKRCNWKISAKNYLVFGDNCELSFDSGVYGLISESQIIGRIFIN